MRGESDKLRNAIPSSHVGGLHNGHLKAVAIIPTSPHILGDLGILPTSLVPLALPPIGTKAKAKAEAEEDKKAERREKAREKTKARTKAKGKGRTAVLLLDPDLSPQAPTIQTDPQKAEENVIFANPS